MMLTNYGGYDAWSRASECLPIAGLPRGRTVKIAFMLHLVQAECSLRYCKSS